MSTGGGRPNARWINHRITAHRMHRRGQSIDTIADHLRVSTWSVSWYLEKECPEPLAAEPEVTLQDFALDGACGEFPEYDWSTRSPAMQRECKAICQYCPVLEKCRSYGLNQGRNDSGIWGALTKSEREREIARQRRTSGRPDIAAAAQQQGAA